jgi:hypothetical protein
MTASALALAIIAFVSRVGMGADKYGTWIAPLPNIQLYGEAKDDQKGMGRIFVPAMTSPANEPLYAVFKGDELIGEQNTGSSFFLDPGHYTVVLGTGSLEQRIKREVDVGREATVIVEPDWSAITVEVIDEVRNYVKQDMQIFKVENAESYGLVPAINPELGEQLQTLILPAGLYKIIKRGEDFNTYVNFTTVTLEPGSYTPWTIVVDTTNGKFAGAGILTVATKLRQSRNWKLYGAVHGSVEFNSANDATLQEVKNNFTLLAQLDNQIVYDKLPHYYLTRNLLEIRALQQEGARFLISQNRLQLKNTYIYYLLKWLGGYGRLETTTYPFPTVLEYASKRNIRFVDLNGNVVKERFGIRRVTTQPPFYPLQFKEGFGANITPLRSFRARLSVRAGLGYWQTYNRGVYHQGAVAQDTVGGDTVAFTLFNRIADEFPQGLETTLVSNFALLRNLTITTELDVLFPFETGKKKIYDLENFISLGVTKNVTLEHTLRLKKDQSVDYTIQEQFISLRLSYYLF